MDHEAVLSFEYCSPERARRVERALRPEIGDIDDDRSRATLSRDGSGVDVTIAASDLVALRAGLNTWLSLVNVAEQVGQTV